MLPLLPLVLMLMFACVYIDGEVSNWTDEHKDREMTQVEVAICFHNAFLQGLIY